MIGDNVKRVLDNINKLSLTTGEKVTLVGVSKNHTADEVRCLINEGVTTLGENRVKEFCDKYEVLPSNIDWHLIGTLQTNKVKYVVGKVKLIQSVDSIKLAEALNDYSKKVNTVSDILIQINPSGEITKHGFDPVILDEVIEKLSTCSNINVKGLMMMAPKAENEKLLSELFEKTRKIFDNIMKYNAKYGNINTEILSMGMSSDYELAIKCGSNMVRVGTALFE